MYRIHLRRASRRAATAAIALMTSLWTPGEALAQCHIASFEENEITVAEHQPGYVELAVELEGDPLAPVTCSGRLTWETHSRTARAPGDFTDSEGELRWSPGSSRRQTFRVPVHNDSLSEGTEKFGVELRAAPGSGIQPEEPDPVQGGPVATVTITDDEPPSGKATPPPGGSTTPGAPGTRPSTTPSIPASPRGVQRTPTVASFPTGDPSATATATGFAAGERKREKGSGGAMRVVAIVGLAGVGTAWWVRRRSAAR